MTAAKTQDITDYRFKTMEKNLTEIKEEMKLGFDKIFLRLDGMDQKYPSMREHFENKEKIKSLENKVEGINTKIATWSGSIIILAFIGQQIFDKLSK